MEKIKVYMRGWLNYYGIVDMKKNVESLNGWLYRRIRTEWVAREGAYSRKAYWRMAGSGVVQRALTKERLINWGFYDLATAYQSMHVNY